MSLPRLLLIGLVIVLLTIFGNLADEVTEGDTLEFDTAVLMALRDADNPGDPIGPHWFEEAVRDITALGSFAVLTVLVTGVVLFLVMVNQRRSAGLVLVSVLGGTIISTVLKAIFDRPRPEIEGVARVFTASFPSGHATISAVVYLTLGALLAEVFDRRRLRAFFISGALLMTLLVGLSRIYMGVHYPTDVLAGWSIGGAWALLCWLVVHFIRHPEDRPQAG